MKLTRAQLLSFFFVFFLSFLITASPALSQEKVKIGVITPLTGAIAHSGKDHLIGAEIAADRINAAGGIRIGGKKYLLEIVALDDQYKPDLTVTALRRMLGSGIKIISTLGTGQTMAALELADQEGFLLLHISTGPSTTAKGVKLGIRIPSTMDYYASSTADALLTLRPQVEKVAVLWNTDPGHKAWGEIFSKTWTGHGKKIISNEGIDFRKVTDFYPILTKILPLKPDALLVITMDEPLSLVVKQARELGYQGYFLAYEGTGDKIAELAGPEIDSKFLVVKTFYVLDPKKMEYLKEAYKKKAPGILPGTIGANGHEMVYIAALAMEKAGTVSDMQALRQAIPKIVPFPESMRGIISFDEKGDNVSTFVLADYVKGKWVYLAKVYKKGDKSVIEYIK
ncbi:MAG: ABC transporter substrate-binding protein [Thermodesulfobacteriota bacterium]|jgi:branched-chain amino acid transport system substrate-binding protein